MNPGKIYILRNPYHKDALVKIGRTSRISETRAKEISAGSGVPADFEVLYEEDVFDCVEAERIIHESLHLHRVNKKREFFQLPLKQAVTTVFQTCLRINDKAKQEIGDRLIIFFEDSALAQAFTKVKETIAVKPGKTPVHLVLETRNSKQVVITAGKDFNVEVCAELINALKDIKGVSHIRWMTKDIIKLFPDDRVEGKVLSWDNED